MPAVNGSTSNHGFLNDSGGGTSDSKLVHLMNESGLRQIRIVDEKTHAVDVVLLNEMVKDYELPLTTVAVAGG